MSRHFDTHVMSKYAELCVMWRMELVSCRSNAEDLNAQLASLEEVIKAFGIGAPGIVGDSEPVIEPEPKALQPKAQQDTQPQPEAAEPKPQPKAAEPMPQPKAAEPTPQPKAAEPKTPESNAEDLKIEEMLQPRRRDKIPQPRRAEPELVEV